MKKMDLRLRINGQAQQWSIAPGDILLDVLRREGYFGVKRGCEKGECGACTVLVNGKAINSCLMFAAQAEGSEVLTIEGLAEGGTLHPLQESFLDHGAVQCGFCTGGMILNAKALLDRNPHPTDQEVREVMAGNYCRCTGYQKPVEAVLAAVNENSGADPLVRAGRPGPAVAPGIRIPQDAGRPTRASAADQGVRPTRGVFKGGPFSAPRGGQR
jgi:aerobic-type carbon monoxide dehydrogenase small subunit (CoxS/CutS family)